MWGLYNQTIAQTPNEVDFSFLWILCPYLLHNSTITTEVCLDFLEPLHKKLFYSLGWINWRKVYLELVASMRQVLDSKVWEWRACSCKPYILGEAMDHEWEMLWNSRWHPEDNCIVVPRILSNYSLCKKNLWQVREILYLHSAGYVRKAGIQGL